MPAFTSLKQPVHTKPSMSPRSEATARALQRIFCAANNLAGIGSQHKKSNLRSPCCPACQPNCLATRLSRRPELKQSRLLIICIRYMGISCVASWLSQSASEGQLCETDETKHRNEQAALLGGRRRSPAADLLHSDRKPRQETYSRYAALLGQSQIPRRVDTCRKRPTWTHPLHLKRALLVSRIYKPNNGH